MTFTSVIDILAVAVLIYELLLIVRGTRAAQILLGIGTLTLIYGLSVYARLEALRSLLSYLVPYFPIAVIILFQSEIRRTLARIGRKQIFGAGFRRLESVDEILLAMSTMAQDRIGALIVLERDIGLRTFIESGVRLVSIFLPGTPLHDGAVVIQKDRIAAAACFLPLSTNPSLSGKLGTRHRGGIGITEETDCLSLIVSEETGWMSVAIAGELEQNLTTEEVELRINRHFGVGR
jgi:diadenylate cyclase